MREMHSDFREGIRLHRRREPLNASSLNDGDVFVSLSPRQRRGDVMFTLDSIALSGSSSHVKTRNRYLDRPRSSFSSSVDDAAPRRAAPTDSGNGQRPARTTMAEDSIRELLVEVLTISSVNVSR